MHLPKRKEILLHLKCKLTYVLRFITDTRSMIFSDSTLYTDVLLQRPSFWRSTTVATLSSVSLSQATNKPTDPFIVLWRLTTREQGMVNTSSSWAPSTPFLTSTMRSSSASTLTGSSTGSAAVRTRPNQWPNFLVCRDFSPSTPWR